MTRYALPHSEHERRLLHEGAFLARLFTRLAPQFGVFTLGPDGFVLGLAERLDLDLPGMTAIRIRVGDIEATAITGPGIIFGNPCLFEDLMRLRREAIDRGRRIVIVPKRSLKRHARRRLPTSVLMERPGRTRSERRRAKTAGLEGRLNARRRVPIGVASELAAAAHLGADQDA